MDKNASQRASNTQAQRKKRTGHMGGQGSAWIKDKNESKRLFSHHHHLNRDGPQAWTPRLWITSPLYHSVSTFLFSVWSKAQVQSWVGSKSIYFLSNTFFLPLSLSLLHLNLNLIFSFFISCDGSYRGNIRREMKAVLAHTTHIFTPRNITSNIKLRNETLFSTACCVVCL